MKSQMNGFGDLLPTLAKHFKDNPVAVRAIIFAAFRRAIGAPARQKAVPTEFNDGVLAVSVADSTWAKHMESLAPAVLARISALLGSSLVQRIEFLVSGTLTDHTSTLPEQVVNNSRRSIRYECPAGVRLKAETIRDERLRSIFTDAASSCIATRRNQRVSY